MNYTEKYHLPQWEKSDRILMDDFNRMCLDLEAGLDKTAKDAAGNTGSVAETAAQASASAAAAAAEAARAAGQAQAVADQALAAANSAYCPGYEPFVVGTYTVPVGVGGVYSVSLNFAPSAVIIAGFANPSEQRLGNAYMSTREVPNACITCTQSGFTINVRGNFDPPYIITEGQTYAYIAFR